MQMTLATLVGEVQFWHALALLLGSALTIVLVVPALSELVARSLHAHAIALTALVRVVAAGGRAYKRIYVRVMEETAQ